MWLRLVDSVVTGRASSPEFVGAAEPPRLVRCGSAGHDAVHVRGKDRQPASHQCPVPCKRWRCCSRGLGGALGALRLGRTTRWRCSTGGAGVGSCSSPKVRESGACRRSDIVGFRPEDGKMCVIDVNVMRWRRRRIAERGGHCGSGAFGRWMKRLRPS